MGKGPALTAAADPPDLHHFQGSFGGKHVIPLWRDAEATKPNVTPGVLTRLNEVLHEEVSPEDLFAYAYGVMGQPAFSERFWEDLELPPPRLPITKERSLFFQAVDLGRRLIHLHTYGERFGTPGVPRGEARQTVALSADEYPEGHQYDRKNQVLHVGAAEFAPVSSEVYDYAVSNLSVVKSWLDYRKQDRAGKSSSDLDDVRPQRWTFAEELLDLLWVLEQTVALHSEGRSVLAAISTSSLFSYIEMPMPSAADRLPLSSEGVGAAQGSWSLT